MEKLANSKATIERCKKYLLLAKEAYGKAIAEYNFKYEDLFNLKKRTLTSVKRILTDNGRLALLDMEQDNPLRGRYDFNSSIDYIIYLSQIILFCAEAKTVKLPDSAKYEYVNIYLD